MLKNLRPQSPRLVFAVSFVIVLVTVSVTLMWSSDSKALEGRGLFYPAPVSGDYQGPHCCRECHKSEFDAWSHSKHAQAVIDPVFQMDLQQAEQPHECFACHTTGYDENSGRFLLAGVTCEACHGAYQAEHPSDHPSESMVVPISPDLCGGCHSNSLAEWQANQHGELDQSCINCHHVHSWSAPT